MRRSDRGGRPRDGQSREGAFQLPVNPGISRPVLPGERRGRGGRQEHAAVQAGDGVRFLRWILKSKVPYRFHISAKSEPVSWTSVSPDTKRADQKLRGLDELVEKK